MKFYCLTVGNYDSLRLAFMRSIIVSLSRQRFVLFVVIGQLLLKLVLIHSEREVAKESREDSSPEPFPVTFFWIPISSLDIDSMVT